MTNTSLPSGQSGGPAVDRQGAPVVDPTANVTALVLASNKRIDDLMAAGFRRIDDLLSAHATRLDERFGQESKHVREISEVRALYEQQLRAKETDRIDAIRAVDVSAVARASEVASAQAATLATQVQVSAETLRNQVQAAAVATQTALAQALEPVQKDIGELRKTQYEQQGQRQQQQEGRGTNQWVVGTLIGLAVVAIDVILKVIGK